MGDAYIPDYAFKNAIIMASDKSELFTNAAG